MLRIVRYFSVAAALSVAMAPSVVFAQALPPASELVARFAEAIGGREALMKHQTIRSIGSFEMPAAGLKGDLRVVQSKDGKSAMTITMPGIGELAGGYDGTVGWSMNPMQGPRVLEGKELMQMQEEAGFLPLLRESSAIDSMVTVEKTTIGDVPCYKVKISYKSGRQSYDCYGVETGLLAGTMAVQESNLGTIEITTAMTDWKEFGGVKFATRMRQQAMGQEQVLSVNEVVFDDPSDAAALELPAPVKAVLAQKQTP